VLGDGDSDISPAWAVDRIVNDLHIPRGALGNEHSAREISVQLGGNRCSSTLLTRAGTGILEKRKQPASGLIYGTGEIRLRK